MMRPLSFCVLGLLCVAPQTSFADTKPNIPKPATGPGEVRYFTALDGLMDGNADVVLKENRQGKTVTSAVLDVCYPAQKGSDRKDRFVANLAVNGQTLSGTAQTLVDKLPVTVKLVRKPSGDAFEFKGQIGIGTVTTEVNSTDNSDLSEKEFLDNQSTDDGITAQPKDFTDVSPESIGLRLKLDAVADFLRGLKGQPVEVSLAGLAVSCEALRSGEQTINLSVDPQRAEALVTSARSQPGVITAGWTSGTIDMERTVRLPAADWRDGDKINRDKLTSAVTNVLARTLAAKPSGTDWNANTGRLKLTFKRPSSLFPALELTETLELTAMIAPDKPGATDHLLLWVSSPQSSTRDENTGARLNLSDQASGEEEVDQIDDGGAVDALAREFKGQRWDGERSAWK